METRSEPTRVLLLGTTEVLVEMVEQPSEELDRISLLFKSEFPSTDSIHFLEELVGTDLTLEQPRIPDLLRKSREPLKKL